MPGSWAHLAARFVDSVRAKDLTPDERTLAGGWCPPALWPLFESQSVMDRRHSFECALWVTSQAPGRDDLVAAALLHDVGKSAANLGVMARVAASILAKLGMKPHGRLGAYLDHARIGAALLKKAGADRIVVAYAAQHHATEPPDGIDPEDWRILVGSDRVHLRNRAVPGTANLRGDNAPEMRI